MSVSSRPALTTVRYVVFILLRNKRGETARSEKIISKQVVSLMLFHVIALFGINVEIEGGGEGGGLIDR